MPTQTIQQEAITNHLNHCGTAAEVKWTKHRRNYYDINAVYPSAVLQFRYRQNTALHIHHMTSDCNAECL